MQHSHGDHHHEHGHSHTGPGPAMMACALGFIALVTVAGHYLFAKEMLYDWALERKNAQEMQADDNAAAPDKQDQDKEDRKGRD